MRADRVRRAAALLIPVLLVLLGTAARAVAARALREFTAYETPFALSPVGVRTGEPRVGQVVVVLVDGLGLAGSRGLPFLDELRARGADYDCRIGEPSLSLPGRAVMLSGAWAEVHGQTTNYHPRRLRVEHLFSVARAQGLLTALAAGGNGLRLFAPDLRRAVAYAKDPEAAPFAVYEAAQARQGEQARALLAETRGQPGIVMVELHAVDEAGHGWGAGSSEYRRAAAQADDIVRGFASALDLDRDTLLVTGDHGHVPEGGHGGPEEDVLHVPLVLAGAAIRPGARGQARQIDIASTVSTLLGLAVPSSNQGRPLLDALNLDVAGRVSALQAVVAQRERFVAGYVYRLATLDDPAAPSEATVDAKRAPPAADEAWYLARLDALDAREKAARQARRTLETEARARPAVVLAVMPLVLAVVLVRLGVLSAGELGRAALAGAAAVVLYHAALPLIGVRYTLTAVNKDEWLPAFFRKDMALGLGACALAIAVGAWRERRRFHARLFDLARFGWLVAAVVCYAFLVKTIAVFWDQGVSSRWQIADMRSALGLYLDVLVVMAIGLVSPLMALPAWLAALRPPPLAAAAGAGEAARGVL